MAQRILFATVLAFGCIVSSPADAGVLLVDNLSLGSASSTSVDSDDWVSTAFNTGTFSGGLESVVIRMSKGGATESAFLEVTINQDGGTAPGSTIAQLSTSDTISTGSRQNITFTPTTAVTLNSATNYWIVVGSQSRDRNRDNFSVEWTDTDQQTASFGASIADQRFDSGDNGASWSAVGGTSPMRMQINAVPEPASIVLLGLGVAGIGVGVWRRRKVAKTTLTWQRSPRIS